MKHTPKTFVCPHCGKSILNACDEAILAALRKKPTGLSWSKLLEETKMAKGTLSIHLNELITRNKVEVGLDDHNLIYLGWE